jgi:hypothetical protein
MVPGEVTGRRNALRFWRRAACKAFSWSRNAALSVSAVLPCVGATQAVGQRVTPLLRRKSDIATSYSVWLIGRISRRQVPERALGRPRGSGCHTRMLRRILLKSALKQS